MRLSIAAALLLLVGCSSESSAGLPSDAGSDSRVACGVPGTEVDCICESGASGRGACLATGAVLCSCAPLADSGADAQPEAAVDAVADVAVDSGDPVQKALCEAGAPRLTWSAGACSDNGTADLKYAPFVCVFTKASDGQTRCLPAAKAVWGAWQDVSCKDPKAIAWTTDPVPDYMMVSVPGESTAVAVETLTGSPFNPWVERTASGCVERAAAYPHVTPKGLAVFPRRSLDVTAFYAAPPI